MASLENAIELETKQNLGDFGQSERLDREKQLGQNQIKYIPKEPQALGKDPNAAGSHASTASTGGAGDKTRKR